MKGKTCHYDDFEMRRKEKKKKERGIDCKRKNYINIHREKGDGYESVRQKKEGEN